MLWGSFGAVHIASLVLGAAIIIGLYFLLRKCRPKTQTLILGILSFSGIAAVIFNLVSWDSPWEYLPLHLCSLNALVLPIAVFSKNKMLSNLLLLWSLGAVMALVVNSAQAGFEVFSSIFFFYFFPHLLEFGIPILLFVLGHVKKELKYIASTILITFIACVVIHFANVGLNDYFAAHNILTPAGNLVTVNYMYTLRPENPVLALFWSLIPYPFWYLMPVLAIIAVYLGLVYLPQIIALCRQKQYQKSRKAGNTP